MTMFKQDTASPSSVPEQNALERYYQLHLSGQQGARLQPLFSHAFHGLGRSPEPGDAACSCRVRIVYQASFTCWCGNAVDHQLEAER